MPNKQKSGLYRTKVKVGISADGKPIQRYISGRTKAELERERQKVLARYVDGSAQVDDQVLGAYAVTWFKTQKEPVISGSSRASYRTMLNKHVLPLFGDRMLRSIRPAEIQEFISSFAGRSHSEIGMALGVMRQIYASAMRDMIVKHDPTRYIVMPKSTPPKERRALTPDERLRIADVCASHPDGMYLACMFYTGMRPGEVRGLQWGDFDFAAGLIHVQRDVDYSHGAVLDGLKTRAADRYVPITDELRRIVYPRRQAPQALLFPGPGGKPMAQVTAGRLWIRLMDACGMCAEITDARPWTKPDLRNQRKPIITPHALRHNFITMCWESGMDILLTQKIVGHADFATTRDIYTHLSKAHLANSKAQMDAMFDLKSCTKVAQEADAQNG